MATMSDDGERTCPLCAEEMDLTDQQLKPCKCGYEICVWCWHHIMDMAEKEETEGRCPACRTPYDKERIVGMAANCERVVAEINAEKKQKSQKAKPKAEARKHLSSVRVIQRNLVYIIGLPSNLCDESILERREYFGQYGKVLKVSISRPSSSAAQQASNNSTFSVYITYAREEEAVRCIQAVHNFVLEGKSLRACFGTTKYCHAWLRNMTCSNPDCLYLHDIGSQEDSFTKDEIISAYTRSRVPQIASNNSQRRSGNVLPPPADDFSSSGTVTGKQAVKSVSNNAPSPAKGSPPNSSGKPTILPAAASWGLRSSSGRTLAVSTACSQTPVKHKVETLNSTTLLSSMTASTKQSSAWHDDMVTTSKMPERRHVIPMNGISRPSEPSKPGTGMDCRTVMSSEAHTDADCICVPSAWNDDVIIVSKTSEPFISANGKECRTSGSDLSPDDALETSRTFQDSVSCLSRFLAPEAEDKGRDINLAGANTKSMHHLSKCVDRQSSSADEAAKGGITVNGNIEGLCLDLSSVSIDNHLGLGQSSMDQHQTSKSNLSSRPQQSQPEQVVEHLSSEAQSRASSSPETHFSNELLEWDLEPQKQGFMSTGIEREDDVNNRPSCSPYLNPPKSANQSSYNSWNNGVGIKHPLYAGDSKSVETKVDVSSFVVRENESALCNGHKEDEPSSFSNSGKVFESPEVNCSEERLNCLGKTDAVANSDKTSLDMGESSIISDILSLDFDPWDISSSANNFARLLGETDKQHGSFKLSSSWKSQNSNQSRFSFARQESQASGLEASLRDSGNAQKLCSPLQDASGDGFQSRLQFNNFEGPHAVFNSNPVASCDRLVGVSRAKISAPPGFSSPSRAPPPGFSSQDRLNQAYDTTYSDNHLLSSPSLGNQYQAHLTGNPDDVEFIDPAILAVGKGRMPLGINNSVLSSKAVLPSQFSTSNSDPRLQLLMQQSSSHQNLRVPDHVGDRYLPLNDTYMTSRLLAQNHGSLSPFTQLSLQQPRSTQISIGQWSGWNDVRTGSEMSMPDILRNERFGINNFYSGSEEHKFHIPSSADLYNRAFGL